MTTNIQTLYDALIALAVTAGIAVSLSIAMMAAAAIQQRGRAQAARAARPTADMAKNVSQTDDGRPLILR
jgi:hypothetical protein